MPWRCASDCVTCCSSGSGGRHATWQLRSGRLGAAPRRRELRLHVLEVGGRQRVEDLPLLLRLHHLCVRVRPVARGDPMRTRRRVRAAVVEVSRLAISAAVGGAILVALIVMTQGRVYVDPEEEKR